jgi:hypothetical protein
VRKIVGDAVKVFARDLGCILEDAHPGRDNPLMFSGAWWCAKRT